jgi:hypothetical protein
MLASGPFTRHRAGECGSTFTSSLADSGRVIPRQICAHAMKKRWSAVRPSMGAGSGFPSSDLRKA